MALAIVLAVSSILDIRSHAHQESIMPLVNKIIISVVLFCVVIVYFQYKEKKYLMKLYQRIRLQEKMMQSAVQNSNALILIYDLKRDELQIMNPQKSFIDLPDSISNARDALLDFLKETPDISGQLAYIFRRIQRMEQEEVFGLHLQVQGILRTYQLRVNSVRDAGNEIVYTVGVLEDLTEQEHLKQQVRMREGFLFGLLGFIGVDLNEDRILHVSEKLSMFYREDMSFTEFMDLQIKHNIAVNHRSYVQENINTERLLQNYHDGILELDLEYQGYDAQGQIIWRDCEIHLNQDWQTGNVMAYIVIKNIEDDKQKEFVLLEKASRDYLTGLYNRGGAEELIDQYLSEMAGKEGVTSMFLLLDLDNFKQLNDTLGHQMGDRALQEVADVLRSHFREYDIICRLAGDEFVVLMKEMPQEAMDKNMQALLKKIEREYCVGENAVSLSASVGVSIWPGHGGSFDDLYRKADVALYHAKENGKRTYMIYQDDYSQSY